MQRIVHVCRIIGTQLCMFKYVQVFVTRNHSLRVCIKRKAVFANFNLFFNIFKIVSCWDVHRLRHSTVRVDNSVVCFTNYIVCYCDTLVTCRHWFCHSDVLLRRHFLLFLVKFWAWINKSVTSSSYCLLLYHTMCRWYNLLSGVHAMDG